MADSTKAQKLAAARKKLKEFQQKSQKAPKTNESKEICTPSDAQSAAESMASSTHSLETNQQNTTMNFEGIGDIQASQLQNYFNAGHVEYEAKAQPNFFDNYSYNNQENAYNNNENVIAYPVEKTNEYVASAPSVDQFFSYEIRDADAVSENDPELKLNQVFDNVNYSKSESFDHFGLNNQNNDNVQLENTQVVPNIETNSQNESNIKNEYSQNIINELNLQNTTQINEISPDYEPFNLPTEPTTLSNLESLNQLSSQLHHAVSDYETYDLKHNNELEKRNQELASLLEKERIKNEEMRMELLKYKERTESLEKECSTSKTESEEKLNNEVGPLQEQLQYHMQTVGILVAEKTELTASLSQSQILAKQKTSECEELQGRLKASRSRAADLEKELNNMKAEKSKFEQLGSENNVISEKYKNDVKRFELEKEELTQDLSELREKFNISAGENLKLQHEIQELNAQLSLATVKIQQLSNGEIVQNEAQFEALVQQKLLLEKHISDLQQNIKTVTNERDQASIQYQQYTQQLNTQLSNIAQKLETTTQQNESLVKREQELIQHIGELEKHLQSLQNDHVNFNSYKNNNGLKKELEDAIGQLNELKTQNEALTNNLETYRTDNEDLLKDLASKKDVIAEMEGKIERLEGNQPDSAKLLAAMESDKVAAARAVHQNTQLKKQLEDMEEVFIKMSNDKLELTEQLTSIQHQNKELTEKFKQSDHHLKMLTEAIEIKDRELHNIREGTTELNKQVLQQNQLADRLRHYEAQEHSASVLQNELQEALRQIEDLKTQNNNLNTQITTLQNTVVVDEAREVNEHEMHSECGQHSTNVNAEDTLRFSLENEALKRTIEELESVNKSLNERIEVLSVNNGENKTDFDKENGLVDSVSILNREKAMQQLEEKFKKTMDDIAELQDEKQRLEHVVLQLQGETETIGEYIALYRHQRGILNQRTIEKENQLKKIANDREEMRAKLDQLNSLIKRLILGNATLPSDILEEHKQITEDTLNHIDENEPLTEKLTNGVTNEIGEKNRTAQKIIDLLSEIKTNTLVSSSELASENVHCPCCSGHLITV